MKINVICSSRWLKKTWSSRWDDCSCSTGTKTYNQQNRSLTTQASVHFSGFSPGDNEGRASPTDLRLNFVFKQLRPVRVYWKHDAPWITLCYCCRSFTVRHPASLQRIISAAVSCGRLYILSCHVLQVRTCRRSVWKKIQSVHFITPDLTLWDL